MLYAGNHGLQIITAGLGGVSNADSVEMEETQRRTAHCTPKIAIVLINHLHLFKDALMKTLHWICNECMDDFKWVFFYKK